VTTVTRASTGMEAASAARKRLIEAHQEEYKNLLKEERTRRGLSPEPGKSQPSTQKLLEQEQKLEERLGKIREQLSARGQ